MRGTKDIIVKGIIFSLIPALCNFMGSTDAFLWAQKRGYIGKNVDIECLKLIFFIASIFLTFALLTVNIILSEVRENIYRRQAAELIKYTKEIVVMTLAKIVNRDYCHIDVRIFVPEKTLKWRITHIINKNNALFFRIRNIDGLAEAGITNDLKFQVLPPEEKQGLVGECFVTKKMVYDDNLIQSNSTDYHLSEYQINKTNDLRFIIVCPIFSENGEVIAIIAFDSKNDIKVTQENKEALSDLILNYTQQLYEKVPELFKAKGGLL